MDNEFVVVARSRSLMTALYYRELLEAEGIQAFVPDEYTSALQAPEFYFLSVDGSLRLLVPAQDEARAREILAEVVELTEDDEEKKPDLARNDALPPVADDFRRGTKTYWAITLVIGLLTLLVLMLT